MEMGPCTKKWFWFWVWNNIKVNKDLRWSMEGWSLTSGLSAHLLWYYHRFGFPLLESTSPLVHTSRLCVSCGRSPCREGSLVPTSELQILWRVWAGASPGNQQGEHFCWESHHKPNNKQSFTVGVGWQRDFSKVCITQERTWLCSARGGLAWLQGQGLQIHLASILPVRMYSGKWYWFKCSDRYHWKETINDVMNPKGVFQSKAPRSFSLHPCEFLSSQEWLT